MIATSSLDNDPTLFITKNISDVQKFLDHILISVKPKTTKSSMKPSQLVEVTP
jgi:hypothetical protein